MSPLLRYFYAPSLTYVIALTLRRRNAQYCSSCNQQPATHACRTPRPLPDRVVTALSVQGKQVIYRSNYPSTLRW